LYNDEKKSFEKKYYGMGIVLSQDKKHVAYAVSMQRAQRYVNVSIFIDECMVYPSVQNGFVFSNLCKLSVSLDGRRKNLNEYSYEHLPSKLVSRITWKDETTIEFVICENWLEAEVLRDENKASYLHYAVRLADGAGQDPQILVKEPIKKEDLAKFGAH